MTRAAVLLALLLALPATAAAQGPPPCAPDRAMDARVTVQERGEDAPIIATHEVDLTADVANRTAPVSSSPDHVVITPEAGVEVLAKGSGGSIISVFAPSTPTLTVTVSWRQSTDPTNFDEDAKCSGSQTLTLPVLAANPARGVKQPNPGPDIGDFTFAVAPANRRPNLSPIQVSIRSTAKVRFPRANERLRTWTVPMRGAEQLKYRTRLPNYAYATFAQLCRSWWMTCGPVNSHLSQLNANERGRPDLDGSNAILRPLAFSQPARYAVSFGFVVSTFPGAANNRPFGYDVQVRQAGRLLARVRKAGRCREIRRNGGFFHSCRLARSSVLLR